MDVPGLALVFEAAALAAGLSDVAGIQQVGARRGGRCAVVVQGHEPLGKGQIAGE